MQQVTYRIRLADLGSDPKFAGSLHEQDIQRVVVKLDSAFWRADKFLERISLAIICGGAAYYIAAVILAFLRGSL